MSFLDHLEELRLRLFKCIAAITVGCLAGWFLVDRFHLVAVLKAPIAPYLPDGKLIVLSPTEPLMIVLKLAVILGCVLASPVVVWQVWGFLSPALYARERRIVVPALSAGVLLFLTGAVLAFVFVVPQVLGVLFSFQTDSLATMITFEKYFDFVVQLCVAMGISFELPLVIMILASFGVVTPGGLNRFRRVAIILSLVAGAVLSPGTDVFSMLMLSIPLILLYEVGWIGTFFIWRRKQAAVAAAVIVAALLMIPGKAEAQGHGQPPRPPSGNPLNPIIDTTKKPAKLDSAAARRMGLPSAPSHEFPANDSILDLLLARPGFEATRFRADSATLHVPEHQIDLRGGAMTERNGSILEAHRIGYEQSSCVLDARGDPRVFDHGTVLVGEGLRYNTCERRAVVSAALTNFQENGVEWFMRGTLSQDSTARRIYAVRSQITSCDLPDAHYHFSAHESKWISKSVLVARPAVLYVRDVPILWLPFIFQDGRPGRRSGILVPKFGLNDIVRPSKNYSRQVSNVGYFWAPNEYFDATARVKWYAGRMWGAEGDVGYVWLDRNVRGSAGVDYIARDGGGNSLALNWNHLQKFSLTSTLSMTLSFVNGNSVRNRTSILPTDNTRLIRSSATYERVLAWGRITVGGTRQQSLTDKSVQENFPSVTFSPSAITFGQHVTWIPSLSFTQSRDLNATGPGYPVVLANDSVATLGTRADSRHRQFALSTPLTVGSFTWQNSFSVTDDYTNRVTSENAKEPDLSTPDPFDSVQVTRTSLGDFKSGIDWTTGIALPQLFRGSWHLAPGIGITNVTSGPFMVRNRRTDGGWVTQSKRAQFTLTSNPTFFAFFNHGIGPFSRFRHSVLPTFSWSYSPEASIPEAYAQAVAPLGGKVLRTAPATQTASFGLSQSFEAKGRPAAGDTSATPNVRKYKLIGITTSPIAYDFEQAKLAGRTGWVTQSLSNSFASDLIPGFSVSLTHDLWKGAVGTDTAVFQPYLTGVSANFGLNSATIRNLGRALGIGHADSTTRHAADEPPPSPYTGATNGRSAIGQFGGYDDLQRTGRTGFSSSFTFTLSRVRPTGLATAVATPNRANLGFSTRFSPTAFWAVDWVSQYDVTDHRFVSHDVTLTRDLHDWRATFQFRKNTNGNFEFLFHILLLDLPSVKFDYDQTTLVR